MTSNPPGEKPNGPHTAAQTVQTTRDRPRDWGARDAWECILVLAAVDFFTHLWLRTRSGPPVGQVASLALQAVPWLIVTFYFSRARSVSSFITRTGLAQKPTAVGWCAAWVIVALALLVDYGARRGWSHAGAQPLPALSSGAIQSWFSAAEVIFIVPLYEEIVTRGFLFQAFRRNYGVLVSIGIILAFSATFHWGVLWASPFNAATMTFGWTVLCLVKERTGSTWDCVFCHVVYNSIVFRQWLVCAVVMLIFTLICRAQFTPFLVSGLKTDGDS
jgi:membrane protease YdiL (CAAX protease family)